MANWKFIVKMAWRDSRRDRRRLFISSASIIFGIGALVAIGSLKENLQDAVADQSKALLGADVSFRSGRPIDETFFEFDKTQPPELSREISFATMAYLPKSKDTRLVNVCATEPGFPFYGDVVTSPADAWTRYLKGEGVVLEQSLIDQFSIAIGDIVRLGAVEAPLLGGLVEAPPRSSYFSTFAPQVFLPYSQCAKTGLMGDRSLTSYRVHMKVPKGSAMPKYTNKDDGIRKETVEERQERLGKRIEMITTFLSLIGFIALLLGGVGVASAIHVHVSSRVGTVATLRCLGASTKEVFSIFLIQGLLVGFIGSILGVALGVLIQKTVPLIFAKYLPFPIALTLSPEPIFSALGIGLLLCVSFSLFPLLRVRRISPLAAIRSEISGDRSAWRDPWVWGVSFFVLVVMSLAAWKLSPPNQPQFGVAAILGLVTILVLLAILAKLITWLARKCSRPAMPYTFRQGLANLYRPRNQTQIFLLSTGLGTLLIMMLLLVETMVSKSLDKGDADGKANLFVIDVQADQKDEISAMLQTTNIQILESAALLSMRLESIKGIPAGELDDKPETKIPGWILRRDFRCTFRDHLSPSEQLTSGEWIGHVPADTDVIPVSVEEGIARDLKIKLGDEFAMDLQGTSLKVRVASLRKVDWETMGLNFFIVFPKGVIDDAPSYDVLTARAETSEQTAAFQRLVAAKFKNVSVIDISLIFDTIRRIVSNLSQAIRFMTLFTVFTGLVILVSILLASRQNRLRESVLLRTLGASRSQVRRIFLIEYLLLGTFSVLTAGILAPFFAIPLAKNLFKVDTFVTFQPIVICALVAVALTVIVAMLLSRGITRQPPLAILREE
jgi:putative ABC transport system permease protein